MEEKKDKEKDFDVIFAFAFGSPENLISNHNIAERAKEIYYDYSQNIPLMTQTDIAFSPLLYDERKNYLKNLWLLDFVGCHRNNHFSTLKLIKRFKEYAEINNWKKVLVIAAPMHSKRCVRDLKKMGFDAYEDKYLREKYSMASIWWYHHKSTQFWTRSGLYWWPREIILRLLPWKIYEWISDRF